MKNLTSRIRIVTTPQDNSNGKYAPIVGVGFCALGLHLLSRQEIESKGESFLKSIENADWSKPALPTLPPP
jgi:hypothetical protein